ncbi:hypothetical protein GM160_06460 [Guyparkeria halophila]|uniref:Haem-binding uptake Tiki superfamily ChaN domain-containing protein n=1 Tax=Guyparkeria halophila TaxID=47960 RepID=A0A6I6D304_9GAMM|nr:hypothetical protein GM160_06460 [Guyparkeria halophila]
MNAAVTRHPSKWWLSGGVAPVVTLLVALSGARAETPVIEVGGWWNGQGERVVDDQVMAGLERADVILLGEVHDSAAIHRRQVELLDTLRSAGRPVVLAMEQLDRRDDDDVDRMNVDSLAGGRERAEAGGFDFDGWGWDQYGRLFDWAAQHRAPLWPLNLSREKAMAVAMADGDEWRDQMDGGTLAWIDDLAPSLSLPDEQQDELIDVLERSHCQEIPSSMSSRMLRAQVARDLVMAEAIMAARDAHPDHRVVAVMGNQHARLDRGVGYWLSRLAEDERPSIMSVGMVPINHLDGAPEAEDAFDLMWVAPEVMRDDPCAAVGEDGDEE